MWGTSDLKLIVGLGNPGKKYERTRHNAGFFVVDSLLDFDRNHWVEGKGPFKMNRTPFRDGHAMVAKPTVFMNESGRAVQVMLDQFHISPEQCLVVVDDVNLPLGKIRFRPRGTAGGHHGLESVVSVLGTGNFPRLRIGVGSGDLSGRDLTDYVLGPFADEEWTALVPQIDRARDACLAWLTGDPETVMQRFN